MLSERVGASSLMLTELHLVHAELDSSAGTALAEFAEIMNDQKSSSEKIQNNIMDAADSLCRITSTVSRLT